ncbi:unnamed protein product [Blepharisma stoltei]|uniref:Peptidase M14 domain-containing protein n=1 Tax=Blepharisma stoltei TaxID=1481888 RepID=A0AAU9J812_9CILI|nr:unnamed protein product [Blepharisma stoltei]
MNIENIDDSWLKELYSVIPPPLPLRNTPFIKKEVLLPKRKRFKLKSYEPTSIFHEEICKQQENTERPMTPKEEKKIFKQNSKDKLFLEFLQDKKEYPLEKRENSETINIYCTCKNRSESYMTFKKYIENYIVPIPLYFKDHSDEIFKHPSSLSKFQFVYVKQRPNNFKQYIQTLQDPWLPIYNDGEIVNVGVCELHRPSLQKRLKLRSAALEVSEFIFDSEFESGNLDKVVKVKNNEFNLFLTADTNTKGHTQWFYFSVKNIHKEQTITLDIMNFTKNGSLFNRGMRPVAFSVKQYQKHRQGWNRAGFDVRYMKNSLIRDINGKISHYYTLSFKYKFIYDNDTVYFAYSEPYTYTRLRTFLDSLKLHASNANFDYSESVLCTTLGGLNCPLIKIRPKDTKEYPIVAISARVHPGETVGSWMAEGLLRFLTSNSAEAEKARKCCEFLIIPMLNPDGVVCGNYRSDLSGVDLNRKWKNPGSDIYPTIYSTKELVKGIRAYVDLHGHSKKDYCFMYGNSFSRKEETYWQGKVLPFLLSKLTSHFNYSTSRFFSSDLHSNTARAVVCRELEVLHSFTLEASFHGYRTSELLKEFTREELMEVGNSLGIALYGLIKINGKFINSQESLWEQVELFKRQIDASKRHQILNNFKGRENIRTSVSARKETLSPIEQRTATQGALSFDGGINVLKNLFETQVEDLPTLVEENNSSGSDSDPSEDNFDEEEQNNLQIVAKKVSLEAKLVAAHNHMITSKPSSNHFREIFDEKKNEFQLKMVDSIFIGSRRSARNNNMQKNRLGSLDSNRAMEMKRNQISSWMRYMTPTSRKEQYKLLVLKAQRLSEIPKLKNL